MPKIQTERACAGGADRIGPVPPPLSANIRRHLGSSLRNFYADTLVEPVDARIEALIAQLDKPKS